MYVEAEISTGEDGTERLIDTLSLIDAVMPDVVTSTARIKVAAVGNIFYAINSQDFSLTRDEFIVAVDQLDYGVCQNDNVNATIIFDF